MSLQKKADGIIFADYKLESSFDSLSDEDWLKKALNNTFEELKRNIFSGRNIPKKLIPKEYKIKYQIDNLWWVQLPKAWRLVYSIITLNNKEIFGMVIEYFDHKNYERRFSYN